MSDNCDRCDHGSDANPVERVDIVDGYDLCEPCQEDFEYQIENYYWYDRWTDDHHERLVELLEERDEIDCVHSWMAAGEYVIHTPYVSSELVTDLRDQFGLEIRGFGPRWPQDDVSWDCIDEIGPRFEIDLEYRSKSPSPIPTEVKFKWLDIDYLEDSDKQFDS